jgi:hypothetical protein
MNTDSVITISVRNLVEFVLKNGDLDWGFSGSSRTADAIRCHQALQKASRLKCPPDCEYDAEVSLSYEIERNGITLGARPATRWRIMA